MVCIRDRVLQFIFGGQLLGLPYYLNFAVVDEGLVEVDEGGRLITILLQVLLRILLILLVLNPLAVTRLTYLLQVDFCLDNLLSVTNLIGEAEFELVERAHLCQ